MLIGFAFLSELVYLFLLAESLILGSLDLHNDQHMHLVVVSLLILFVGYFLTYHILDWQKISIKAIIFVTCVFHLTFLFVPGLSSSDLYSYIFTTRIQPIFEENPYFVPYNNFPQDILYKKLETVWANHTTLYGPLFLHLGGLLNKVGQNNLAFLVLAFKSLFTGANLVSAFLIYKISKSKKALFLFAANPLVVFELSGNSHTESLTILFLLISIYFLYRWPVAGFVSFTTSVLVKYYSALFLPFYLIKIKREGIKPLILSLLIGALLTIVAYLPFWRGLENFDYLLSYYNGQYTSPSLAVYLGEVLLGSYRLSFQINTYIFLLLTGVLVYRFSFSKAEFSKFVFYSFLLYWIYLLTKLSLVLSWYLIPLVALGSLCVVWKEYQKYAIASLVFAAVYSLALYYFVR